MKKLLLLSVFSFILLPTYSQYVRQYIETDTRMLQNALNERQAAHDKNEAYLNNLIDWVLELKSQKTDQPFRETLEINYKKLRAFENEDLSLIGREIRQVEINIKEEIVKYNQRMNNSIEDEKEKVVNSQNKEVSFQNNPDANTNTYNKAKSGNGNYMTTIGEFGIYTEPVWNGKIIKMLPENTKVRVYGKVDWFYIVEYNGVNGYMKDAFLK